MPQHGIRFLRQPAVLWPAGPTNEFGQVVPGSPTSIRVRISGLPESLSGKSDGESVTQTITAIVDRKIAVGSLMQMGEYSDIVGTGTGSDASLLLEVKSYEEVRNTRGRNPVRTVTLARYKASTA